MYNSSNVKRPYRIIRFLHKLVFYTKSIHKDAGFILSFHNEDKNPSVTVDIHTPTSMIPPSAACLQVWMYVNIVSACLSLQEICSIWCDDSRGARAAYSLYQRTGIWARPCKFASNLYEYVKTNERCHNKLPELKSDALSCTCLVWPRNRSTQYMIIRNAKRQTTLCLCVAVPNKSYSYTTAEENNCQIWHWLILCWSVKLK